jgi:hypothetical protein
MLPVTNKTPKMLHIAKGKPIFRLDGTKKDRPVSVTQNCLSPFAVSPKFRAIIITTGQQQQLLLVKTSDATEVPA